MTVIELNRLEALLIYKFHDSAVPEIYEVLRDIVDSVSTISVNRELSDAEKDTIAKQCFLRFLDTLAGSVVEIPTPLVMSNAVRDVHIYSVLKKSFNAERIKDLAQKYQLSTNMVRVIYKAVDSIIEMTEAK